MTERGDAALRNPRLTFHLHYLRIFVDLTVLATLIGRNALPLGAQLPSLPRAKL